MNPVASTTFPVYRSHIGHTQIPDVTYSAHRPGSSVPLATPPHCLRPTQAAQQSVGMTYERGRQCSMPGDTRRWPVQRGARQVVRESIGGFGNVCVRCTRAMSQVDVSRRPDDHHTRSAFRSRFDPHAEPVRHLVWNTAALIVPNAILRRHIRDGPTAARSGAARRVPSKARGERHVRAAPLPRLVPGQARRTQSSPTSKT